MADRSSATARRAPFESHGADVNSRPYGTEESNRRDATSHVGLPPDQVGPVLLHDFQQPIILHLAECLIGPVLDQESEVRKQLPKADARRELVQVGELLDQLM